MRPVAARRAEVTRHVIRTRTEGYGVAVEVRVEHAATATPQEVARTLRLAAVEAEAAHAAGRTC